MARMRTDRALYRTTPAARPSDTCSIRPDQPPKTLQPISDTVLLCGAVTVIVPWLDKTTGTSLGFMHQNSRSAKSELSAAGCADRNLDGQSASSKQDLPRRISRVRRLAAVAKVAYLAGLPCSTHKATNSATFASPTHITVSAPPQ